MFIALNKRKIWRSVRSAMKKRPNGHVAPSGAKRLFYVAGL